MDIPSLPLKDGNSIPLLALGTGTAWFKEEDPSRFDSDLVLLLKQALQRGFRHIDCAEMYGTEPEVGVAIKESGIPRDKLFITSKVSQNIDNISFAIDQSLKNLQTDYLDLYLVHEPYFAEKDSDLQTAWKEMELIKKSGRAKSIGVSNYQRKHLQATLETATEIPVVNQLEYHPYLQRADEYVGWMQGHGVEIEAFKPLAPVVWCKGPPLAEPLKRMAAAHNTTVDAVMLRWYIQQNIVAVTTTRKAERLDEYTQALGVKLTPEEIEEITQLGLSRHCRLWSPERFANDDRQ